MNKLWLPTLAYCSFPLVIFFSEWHEQRINCITMKCIFNYLAEYYSTVEEKVILLRPRFLSFCVNKYDAIPEGPSAALSIFPFSAGILSQWMERVQGFCCKNHQVYIKRTRCLSAPLKENGLYIFYKGAWLAFISGGGPNRRIFINIILV